MRKNNFKFFHGLPKSKHINIALFFGLINSNCIIRFALPQALLSQTRKKVKILDRISSFSKIN